MTEGLWVVFEAGAVEDVPPGPGAVEELVREAEVDRAGVFEGWRGGRR